jgi:hypothetical protein
MRLAATQVQFACDWRPLRYKLYATGCQLHVNFAFASTMQSCQFFSSTLQEQFFELKINVIKNLRIYSTHVLAKAYPLTLVHGQIQSRETVPLTLRTMCICKHCTKYSQCCQGRKFGRITQTGLSKK